MNAVQEPACFTDLRLDQVLSTLTVGRLAYDIASFFYQPLHEIEAVQYRHHVLHDLEHEPVAAAVRAFAHGMRRMRERVALLQKLHYELQREHWFLEAIAVYCETVSSFNEQLAELAVGSRGFLGLRAYVAAYADSDAFRSLVAETQELSDELAAITYAVHIKGNRVRVSRLESEPDISEEVERTFAKFQRGAVKDYRVRFRDQTDMNHVEAQILDLVAQLHPERFSRLHEYCTRHERYLDETIGRFDREVQLYLAYLEYIEPLRSARLFFSYPRISARLGQRVVGNDIAAGGKALVMITGANQGGKSTFLRSIGLAQLMMQCGMFVAAESFRANVCDWLFTHYKREEDEAMESGKLDEELGRMSEIADHIAPNCVLLCNESFAATNEREGSEIARQVIRALLQQGIKVLFVTHLFDLADGFYREDLDTTLFLRAERGAEGARPFKLSEGRPLPTSYGEDSYRKVFGTGIDATPAVLPDIGRT